MGYQVGLCSSSSEDLHLLWEPTGSEKNWGDTTFRKVAKSLRRRQTLKAGVSPHDTWPVSSVNHIKTLNFSQPLGFLEHLPLSFLFMGFHVYSWKFPSGIYWKLIFQSVAMGGEVSLKGILGCQPSLPLLLIPGCCEVKMGLLLNAPSMRYWAATDPKQWSQEAIDKIHPPYKLIPSGILLLWWAADRGIILR